jgi:N-acetylglucosamine-6-phosphate deacetylase
VRVGAGHTEATPEQLATAIEAGLTIVIHWSNATGNPRAAAFAGTRCPGIDDAALVFDELSAEIIPDEMGLHVQPLMARLLYKAKGPDRILIITDAGYVRPDDPPEPPGPPRDVSIDADGNLAGSRLTMAGAARNFRRFTGCSWPELFRMAAFNPARLLGMDDRIGSIEVGKQANLIMFDDDLRRVRTFLGGHAVHA